MNSILPKTLQRKWEYKFGEHGSTIKYRGFNIQYPFYEALPSLMTFKADPRDVIISTTPRSGSTWTSTILVMILNDANPDCLKVAKMEELVPYIELCEPGMEEGSRIVDLVKSRPPPRTFFTHLPFDILPESIKATAKVICLERNPKDVILSLFSFVRAIPHFEYEQSLEAMADDFINGTSIFGPFFDHVKSSWRNRHRPNVFFMTYESLAKDFARTVRELGRFLGKDLTDDQIVTIAHHCSFDTMKSNGNTNRQAYKDVGLLNDTESAFFKAGKVGEWKKHFSPDLSKRVDDWIEKEYEKEGFEGFKFEFE